MSDLHNQFIQKYGAAAYERVIRSATHEALTTVGKPITRPALPDMARADVLAGELTVEEFFTAQVVEGSPEDYNLSEFTTAQLGNIVKLKAPATDWAALSMDTGASMPGGQAQPINAPVIPSANGKTQLEQFVKDDIRRGEVTIAELLASGILPGQASDYDLSELTPAQIGLDQLPIGQAALIK
jgi:hypothetical protein